MNILLTLDDNYSPHAGVVISSFVHNNSGDHDFYIVSDFISYKNKTRLQECAQTSHLHFVKVDRCFAEKFPLGKGMANDYVSIATYYRLFALTLLPSDIKRILYIDCDVIIRQDITPLYNSAFPSGCCVCALEESSRISINGCKRLDYPIIYSYFNAGVLLMNLDEIRRTYDVEKAIKYANSHHIIFHDQDILNGLFYNKKTFFQLKYNVLDSFLIRHAQLPVQYKEQRADLFNPVIVHFSGPLKPWFSECKNPYRRLYFFYQYFTPWKGQKPSPKYKSRKDKTKYITKLFIKEILEMLHIRYHSFIRISIK